MTTQLLDDEDKANIEAALARLDALEPEIQRAETAGFDVSEQRERLLSQRQKLRGVKQAFFPNA